MATRDVKSTEAQHLLKFLEFSVKKSTPPMDIHRGSRVENELPFEVETFELLQWWKPNCKGTCACDQVTFSAFQISFVETVKSSCIPCKMRRYACFCHHDVKDSHELREVFDTGDMVRDVSPCSFLCSFPCVFLFLCLSVPSYCVTFLYLDLRPSNCPLRQENIHATCAHLS